MIRRFAILLTALAAAAAFAHEDKPAPKWYRGNTHTHTVLCGHADTTPEAVARWYLDRGYHFLCLSEHNRFIDPATVVLPEGRRKDFILIPGEEITGKHVHMTGLNVDGLIVPVDRPTRTATIQQFTDGTRAAGGAPIINHPNFNWALTAADIRPVKRCYLFELYNGHPSVNNEGDVLHDSTEVIWDRLLTDGMVIYGVSSDDAHTFQKMEPKLSNPGRGWVMVRAAELAPKAISDSIDRGEFYASAGVMLSEVRVTGGEYKVVADVRATEAEVEKPELLGKLVQGEREGWRVDFIGPFGKVVRSVAGHEAALKRDKSLAYLRAKITYTRRTDAALVQYAAWTQPAFNDGRLQKENLPDPFAHDHAHPHD